MLDNDYEKYKAQQFRSNWRARANKKGQAQVDIPSRKEIQEWLHKQKPYTCYFTGELLDRDFGVDHKQPLARGGTYDLDNLCITSPFINAAKGAMTEEEFRSLLDCISTWENKGKELLVRLRASNIYFTEGQYATK